jgi:hypothetical protein
VAGTALEENVFVIVAGLDMERGDNNFNTIVLFRHASPLRISFPIQTRVHIFGI